MGTPKIKEKQLMQRILLFFYKTTTILAQVASKLHQCAAKLAEIQERAPDSNASSRLASLAKELGCTLCCAFALSLTSLFLLFLIILLLFLPLFLLALPLTTGSWR